MSSTLKTAKFHYLLNLKKKGQESTIAATTLLFMKLCIMYKQVFKQKGD